MSELPQRVLFLCTHNSARSQMAEGLLRGLGDGRFEVFSAGTVATKVRPEAIAVMQELGIDIGGQTSKTQELFLGDPFDEVITVCDDANDACPIFPGAKRRRHWSIDDPSKVEGSGEVRLAAFRVARDELRHRIETELMSAPVTSQEPAGLRASSSSTSFSQQHCARPKRTAEDA